MLGANEASKCVPMGFGVNYVGAGKVRHSMDG